MPDVRATVYLVDDEAAVREALAFLFESFGVDVRAFDGGAALLAWLDTHREPIHGCFLLDVRMEGMSGLELHDALVARRVRNPILFLTGHGDVAMAVEALKKGAFDFIEKPYSDSTLVERVNQALAVDEAMRARDARHTEAYARLASLTPREREVMQRVAAGKLNKVVADELHISVRTVEVTRARVFSKLAVRSAAEVATLLATAGER
jgi:two-component system response regulator DctR